VKTEYSVIQKNCSYKTYPLEAYFNNKDSEAQFVVTKLFEENLQREFFTLINENDSPELFFHSVSRTLIPDSAEVSLDILGYYRGVVHIIMNFLTADGELADTKKCAFTIAEKYSSPDLPVMITAIESGMMIVNYYSFEDNEIGIYRRIAVMLTDTEKQRFKECVEYFYRESEENRLLGDILYASDVFHPSLLNAVYWAYEVDPTKDIISIDELARHSGHDKIILLSAIKGNSYYLLSDNNIIGHIAKDALIAKTTQKTEMFFFTFDYYIYNGKVFTIYNDARTSIEIKYHYYQKNMHTSLLQREDVQFFTILLDNNHYDYGMVKEAFLFEQEPDKKRYYAMNILDFSIIEDFELIIEYIIRFRLNDYELHFVSRRISQRHTYRFKNFTEKIRELPEQAMLNLSAISRYVVFYNKVYEIIFMAEHYEIDEIPTMAHIMTESLFEFNKDLVQLVLALSPEKAAKLLSLVSKKTLDTLTRSLIEQGELTQDDIDIKMMDLKESIAEAIHTTEDEMQAVFMKVMRELF